jgi:gliding motility-associated-like protein
VSSTITIDWGDEGLGSVTVIENNKFGCIGNPVTLNIDKSYILEIPTITGRDEVCEFDANVAYDAVAVSGSTFDWTITGGVQTAGTNTASILADWGTQGGGNVSVIQRAFDPVNSRLCVSDPANLPIKIYPKPTADEIIGDMEVCQLGDSVQYTVNGFAGSTFEWRINGDVADVLGQGTRAIKLVWKTAGTMTLSVLETSPAGCPGELVDTLVLVNPKPTTTPILGPATICPESSNNHEYSVIGSATSSFTWEVLGSNDWRGDGTSSITVDWDVTLSSGSLYVLETSDKGCLGDTQRLAVEIDRLAIDMRYISVGTPDNQMIVDWQLEVPADVTDFTIQRKIAGANGSEWQSVNTVSGSTFNFTETGINTDISAYDYRVVATNKCGTLITSEMHTSILLTGIQDEDFNSILEFTEYSGWDNGVSIYDLWLEDNVRNLAIERAGVDPQRSIVVSHDPDQYRKCFRIKADEQDGESTSSWSNEICFFFSPTIYVPNAFTPNGDNLNDGFGVRGVAINEFTIQIYNRWGEKIFQTADINEKWYPLYRGENIPMGTYMYLITFTDYENKAFKKTGTINLIR